MEIIDRFCFSDTILPTSTGVYGIHNKLNGKMYIGSASANGKKPCEKGFRSRLDAHKRDLRKNCHHAKKLQYAYNKYVREGVDLDDVFEVIIIELAPIDECLDVEQMYLDAQQPFYNSCPLAGSMRSFSPSEETRQKMSKARKGRRNSEEAYRKSSESIKRFYASEEGIEVRKRISRLATGRSPSVETRQKISKNRKNKFHSEETKRLFSETRKNAAYLKGNEHGAKEFVGISPSGEIFYFKNAAEFARNNEGLIATTITACAKGKIKRHKKWRFFYKEDYEALQGFVPENLDKKWRSYVAVSSDGDCIYFTNAQQFLRDYPDYGFTASGITACAKGRHKHHKYWHFYYADEYDERLQA